MIDLTEKILVTFLIAIPMFLIFISNGHSPNTRGLHAVFYHGNDWQLIRKICFRDDHTWRPIAKTGLLGLLAVAISCVWIA
ncbi:MAG: hypothetical protein CMJ19_22965 [Phycisphaeraceae bacterium]|nr:hypothetical protein [Phycisphaeraceae bacterium]